jgi:hypothetical protein
LKKKLEIGKKLSGFQTSASISSLPKSLNLFLTGVFGNVPSVNKLLATQNSLVFKDAKSFALYNLSLSVSLPIILELYSDLLVTQY